MMTGLLVDLLVVLQIEQFTQVELQLVKIN